MENKEHLQELAYDYAHEHFNSSGIRDVEMEKRFVKNAQLAYNYALYVIKKRWPEAEPVIIQNACYAYLYARYVIKDRWPEAESVILNSEWKEKYQHFVNSLKTEHEKFFEDPDNQNATSAYHYCLSQVQGRCKEAEKYIIQSLYCAYLYARDVIKNRWLEAESTIMQDPCYAYNYAVNVIKGRWPEAEPIIYGSIYKARYENFFGKISNCSINSYKRDYTEGYKEGYKEGYRDGKYS